METTEQKVHLKVVIEKEKNRVVFAEADRDFIDILFSFMTLPMGTIVRLVNKCPDDSHQVKLGSLSTLYEGVAKIDLKHFSTDSCKDMLLNTRNLLEALCKKLKININDTVVSEGDGKDGVFVTESTCFIIADDLRIMPNSLGTSVALLGNLGIRDMNELDIKTLNFGVEEILNTLKWAVVSKTTLTDLVLENKCYSNTLNFEPTTAPTKLDIKRGYKSKLMTLKLMVQKSNQKVLFAQVEEDFVDFLFSILTIPLGSVVYLLGGNSSLGCVDNLYNSIENLNLEKFVKAKDLTSKLIYPIVVPIFLRLRQVPRTIQRGGFVRGPATFVVTDDLVVTPFSFSSSISALSLIKVPFNDVMEKQVSIGMKEALSILKASLNSTSVFTDLLNLKVKNPNINISQWP